MEGEALAGGYKGSQREPYASAIQATTRCEQHCAVRVALDNAFVLVEGHPESITSVCFRATCPGKYVKNFSVWKTNGGGILRHKKRH